eukprot:SM000032S12073  [mRNA]  locus=s32:286457:290698:- [translate_table: standard]
MAATSPWPPCLLVPLALALLAPVWAQDRSPLFIFQMVTGSSGRAAVQIYNPSERGVSLYGIGLVVPRSRSQWRPLWAAGADPPVLGPHGLFTVCNQAAATTIIDNYQNITTAFSYGGTVPLALAQKASSNMTAWTLLDLVGGGTQTRATGWAVGGIQGATKGHTLVRKLGKMAGSTDWTMEAGMTQDDSGWTVYNKDHFVVAGTLLKLEPCSSGDCLRPPCPSKFFTARRLIAGSLNMGIWNAPTNSVNTPLSGASLSSVDILSMILHQNCNASQKLAAKVNLTQEYGYSAFFQGKTLSLFSQIWPLDKTPLLVGMDRDFKRGVSPECEIDSQSGQSSRTLIAMCSSLCGAVTMSTIFGRWLSKCFKHSVDDYVKYPIAQSKCGLDRKASAVGLPDHFITRVALDSKRITLVTVYLDENITDSNSCAKTEAQVLWVQNITSLALEFGQEVVLLGSLRSYPAPKTANGQRDILQTLTKLNFIFVSSGLDGHAMTVAPFKNTASPLLARVALVQAFPPNKPPPKSAPVAPLQPSSAPLQAPVPSSPPPLLRPSASPPPVVAVHQPPSARGVQPPPPPPSIYLTQPPPREPPAGQHSSKSTSSTGVIVAVVIVLLMAVLGVGLLVLVVRRRRIQRRVQQHQALNGDSEHGGPDSGSWRSRQDSTRSLEVFQQHWGSIDRSLPTIKSGEQLVLPHHILTPIKEEP